MGLAELLLAIGLLTIALLTMVGLFLNLLGSSTKTSNLTAGTFLARARLQELIRKGLYDPVPVDEAVGIYTTDSDNQTVFFHRVTSTRLAPNPPLHGAGYWLEVEVWWWNRDPQRGRAGQGRMSTRVGQFYYPEAGS